MPIRFLRAPISQRQRPREPAVPRRGFDGRDSLSWLLLSRLLLVLVLLLILSLAATTSWLPQVANPWGARRLLLMQAVLILLSGLMIVARAGRNANSKSS